MAHYPPLARQIPAHGDPNLRPERGRGLISRIAGMNGLEADFVNHALFAAVQGARPPVSPKDLVRALERNCDVERQRVRVEITYPADFLSPSPLLKTTSGSSTGRANSDVVAPPSASVVGTGALRPVVVSWSSSLSSASKACYPRPGSGRR
jgi:hypothetical protein